MKLVALVSCYREGNLTDLAIRSVAPHVDQVIVFEGPAGETVSDDAPESVIPAVVDLVYREGRWKSDAAKRSAMVKATRGLGPGPVWAVWVDGDEVLENGAYLRDLVQAVVDRDEPGGPPTAGCPIRIVEMDGSVAVCRAKVVRADLIESYIVSSSGIRFKSGTVLVDHAEGNLPQRISEWWTPERVQAAGEDRFYLEPPLPGEPFLVHRSPLRHPARAGVRMHVQEGRELARLGLLEQIER